MTTLPLFDDPASRPVETIVSLKPVGKLGRERYRKRGRIKAEPGVRAIPRATVDPVGHLQAHADPECLDCRALIAQGFQHCIRCGDWSHWKCQYPLPEEPSKPVLCGACHTKAGGECDSRDMKYDWSFPGTALEPGSIRRALAGEPLPWEGGEI